MNINHVLDWHEFVDQAEKQGRADGYSRDRTEATDWNGGSFKDALKLARGGFDAAEVPLVDTLSLAVRDHVWKDRPEVGFQAQYDVAGAEVDIDRYLTGEPECLIESVPTTISRHGRAVRIVVPICYSSAVNTETILRRGAAVCALVDVLQLAKHPLEIWVVSAIYGTTAKGHGPEQSRRVNAVCVQRASDPLDRERVIYALCHPTALRQLDFAIMERDGDTITGARSEFHTHSGKTGNGNLGYEAFEADVPEEVGTTIVLPELKHSDRNAWNEEFAVAWIKQQLDLIFD